MLKVTMSQLHAASHIGKMPYCYLVWLPVIYIHILYTGRENGRRKGEEWHNLKV